mgnify:CR=1 FL=1
MGPDPEAAGGQEYVAVDRERIIERPRLDAQLLDLPYHGLEFRSGLIDVGPQCRQGLC